MLTNERLYLNADEFGKMAEDRDVSSKILRAVSFGQNANAAEWPFLHTNAQIEPLGTVRHEVWLSDTPILRGRTEFAEWARNDEFAVVRVAVPETAPGMTGPADASYAAYSSLFSVIHEHNFGNLIRIWNYIPDILAVAGPKIPKRDRERYRQFNAGRLRAWEDGGPRDGAGQPLRPAATGAGSAGQPLVLEALLSNDPVSYVENPRQMPAFQYPVKYGSKAPAFARATLCNRPGYDELFISGTGSITRSETTHKGDVEGQINEIIANFKALIDEKNLSAYGSKGFRMDDFQMLRVYVNNQADYPIIRRRAEEAFGSALKTAYLRADLCRPDLLLEMEGVVRSKHD